MLYLISAILLSVGISALFKLFPRYGIDVLQAIVVNYAVCVITGLFFTGGLPSSGETIHASWFPWALALGCLFMVVFYLLGRSMAVNGIATTTVANKLSLAIPAIASVYLYHEAAGWGKIAGVVLAFPAVFLATKDSGAKRVGGNLALSVLVFLGGGILDTALKYVQHTHLTTPRSTALFTMFCFGSAGVAGLLPAATDFAKNKTCLHIKNVIAGVVVGIPNYFSIYTLIQAIRVTVLQSSAIIPVFNISVVITGTLVAGLVFGEPLHRGKTIGLVLSVIAILLIAWGDR